MFKEWVNSMKRKIQVKVLMHIKKLYEIQKRHSLEKCNDYKHYDNKIPLKIEQSNVDYFESNIMAIACIIDDIEYELLVQQNNSLIS